MTTAVRSRRAPFLRFLAGLAVIAAILAAIQFFMSPKFGALYSGLTPPTLRPVEAALLKPPGRLQPDSAGISQGWPEAISKEFHSISQGTRTLPVPLSWLMALEQPRAKPWQLLFGKAGRFMDDDYILRFGFIKSEASEHNPLGLPIGIAVTPMQKIPGIDDIEAAAGFTCAACHTGHLSVNGNYYLVDGGAAATDLGALTNAIAAALGQTFASSKIPFFNQRFKRFTRAVLADSYTDARAVQLEAELNALVKHLASMPSGVDVTEGFSRLDALNRIGNQSFSLDYNRPENYVPPNAPVNYPHIWTASWFDWVQYDGSIMGPLVRNAGEALGVSAYVNQTAPAGEGRFSSSIDYDSLMWIEETLKGGSPLADGKFTGFTGLKGPAWPAEFGEIDTVKADAGRKLYRDNCQMCHLRPLDDEQFGKEFGPITYNEGGEQKETEAVIHVHTVPLEIIGTDAAQAEVLVSRTVNIAAQAGTTNGMGIDTAVCAPEPQPPKSPLAAAVEPKYPWLNSYRYEKLIDKPMADGPTQPFAYALGALVEEVNQRWFDEQGLPEATRYEYEGSRPNCLRAGAGYKARTLDGVWATAPFLHNGSVPTIYDLLSPPEERPTLVQLGGIELNTEHLGIEQDAEVIEKAAKTLKDEGRNECNVDPEGAKKYRSERTPEDLYIDGYFILDTTKAGNCNTGHEFSDRFRYAENGTTPLSLDEQPRGVIGPALSDDDKLAIIEFLKSQ